MITNASFLYLFFPAQYFSDTSTIITMTITIIIMINITNIIIATIFSC